jgi:hypothetical protein
MRATDKPEPGEAAVPQQPSGDVVIYNSSWKLIANAALSFVLAGVLALMMLETRDPSWVSRAGALLVVSFFAGAMVWSLCTLFRNAPALALNGQGIVCDTGVFCLRPIPWSEVRAARDPGKSWYVRGRVISTARSVILDVRDPDRASRWGRWRYSRIWGGFPIPVGNLDMPAEELAETINRYIARRRPGG